MERARAFRCVLPFLLLENPCIYGISDVLLLFLLRDREVHALAQAEAVRQQYVKAAEARSSENRKIMRETKARAREMLRQHASGWYVHYCRLLCCDYGSRKRCLTVEFGCPPQVASDWTAATCLSSERGINAVQS